MKTTERRRLGADDLLRGTGVQECGFTNAGMKACTDGEVIWELADPEMTDIPINFLADWDGSKPDLTGTLKLGAAVKTIGNAAFYKTKLTGLWTCLVRPRSSRSVSTPSATPASRARS